MPTYEYKCEQCGKFEQWQNITEDALTECPTCGSPVRRLISRNVGIIFKGSGFYVTDNRSGGSGEGASSSPKESNKGKSDSNSGSNSGSDSGSSKSDSSSTSESSSKS